MNALKTIKDRNNKRDTVERENVYVVMKKNRIQIFDKRSLNIYDIVNLERTANNTMGIATAKSRNNLDIVYLDYTGAN